MNDAQSSLIHCELSLRWIVFIYVSAFTWSVSALPSQTVFVKKEEKMEEIKAYSYARCGLYHSNLDALTFCFCIVMRKKWVKIS